jgi:hypothetical protein
VQFLGLQVRRDRPCRVYDYSHKAIAKLFALVYVSLWL